MAEALKNELFPPDIFPNKNQKYQNILIWFQYRLAKADYYS